MFMKMNIPGNKNAMGGEILNFISLLCVGISKILLVEQICHPGVDNLHSISNQAHVNRNKKVVCEIKLHKVCDEIKVVWEFY